MKRQVVALATFCAGLVGGALVGGWYYFVHSPPLSEESTANDILSTDTDVETERFYNTYVPPDAGRHPHRAVQLDPSVNKPPPPNALPNFNLQSTVQDMLDQYKQYDQNSDNYLQESEVRQMAQLSADMDAYESSH